MIDKSILDRVAVKLAYYWQVGVEHSEFRLWEELTEEQKQMARDEVLFVLDAYFKEKDV